MSVFPAKLFAVFLLSGLYLATSASLPYANRKSLSHVFDTIDGLRMILARKEGDSGYENMVPSRSLRSRYLSPPPSPIQNKRKAMRAPASPPLVA